LRSSTLPTTVMLILKQVQHDGVYEDHDAQNPIAKRPVFAEKLCVERA
jgi:hypothetical protein